MQESMTGGLTGGLRHGYALVMAGGSVIDAKEIFESSTLGEGPHYIQMEMSESLVRYRKFAYFRTYIPWFYTLARVTCTAELVHRFFESWPIVKLRYTPPSLLWAGVC